jgi:hypothetical protein
LSATLVQGCGIGLGVLTTAALLHVEAALAALELRRPAKREAWVQRRNLHPVDRHGVHGRWACWFDGEALVRKTSISLRKPVDRATEHWLLRPTLSRQVGHRMRVATAAPGLSRSLVGRVLTIAVQRERPVNPEQSHRCMAAALKAAQRSFESAGDRPSSDIARVDIQRRQAAVQGLG